MVKKGYILSESDRTLLSQTVARVNGIPLTPSKQNARHRGQTGGGMEYNGYFKVVDASETKEDGTKTLKLKVIDGADTTASNCGYAQVNGSMLHVPVLELEIGSHGQEKLLLILKSELDMQKIPPVPQMPVLEISNEWPEAKENSGCCLLATIAVTGDAMTIVQQSFGVPNIFIFGSCQ